MAYPMVIACCHDFVGKFPSRRNSGISIGFSNGKFFKISRSVDGYSIRRCVSLCRTGISQVFQIMQNIHSVEWVHHLGLQKPPVTDIYQKLHEF